MQTEDTRARDWTKEQLDAFAQAVAKALGPGWKIGTCDYRHSQDIKDDQGATLHLSLNGHANKWHITGRYQRPPGGGCYDYVRHGETRPDINVSATKTPAQVATDIGRRFLPDYLALWELCEQRRKSEALYLERRAQLRARMVALHPMLSTDKEDNAFSSTYRADAPRLEGHVYAPADSTAARVDLKLSNLSPEQAEQVIKLVMAE